MHLGPFEFRPGLWPSVVTLLLLVLLLGLGFWQLDRAEQKRRLVTQFQGGVSADPIQVDAKLQAAPDLEYQPATVRGRLDPVHQFLLDNRIHQGVVGYEVLTPLLLPEDDVVLLVNRGWVPRGMHREQLPDVSLKEEWVQLRGQLKSPPQKVFTLGEGEDRHLGWPKVLQQIRLELQAEQLGKSLLPMLLLLDPDQDQGYVRQWEPVLGFGPERNVGYALQWFSLALALLVIFLLVNSKRIHDDH